MTQFDVIAMLILGASGLIGLSRGALREITTMIAFGLAVVIALASLRVTGPLARHWLHPAWLGNVAALVAGFLASYLAIRLIGAAMSHGVHDVPVLGTTDRIAGLGIGLLRGFVLLGVFQMVFAAATPRERMPHWISNAVLYPAASRSAAVLRSLEPGGLALVGRLAPALKQAVADGGENSRTDSDGMSVERSR